MNFNRIYLKILRLSSEWMPRNLLRISTTIYSRNIMVLLGGLAAGKYKHVLVGIIIRKGLLLFHSFTRYQWARNKGGGFYAVSSCKVNRRRFKMRFWFSKSSLRKRQWSTKSRMLRNPFWIGLKIIKLNGKLLPILTSRYWAYLNIFWQQ